MLVAETPPRPGRGRALLARPGLVATVAGACLVLIVAMIFSIADGARRVSGHAAELQAYNVSSEQTREARYRVGTAVLLAASGDEAGAVDDATAALDGVATVVGTGVPGDVVELNRFVDTGQELLRSLDAGDVSPTLELRVEEFSAAGAELDERYGQARADKLADLDEANRFLARFGALGGGTVAFLVPTISVYLHRRLRHEQVVVHESHARDRWQLVLWHQRAGELVRHLEELVTTIGEDPSVAAARLEALLTDARLMSESLVIRPRTVDLRALIAERPEVPGLRRLIDDGDGELWCEIDPVVVSAALTSIEWAMAQGGAAAIRVGIETDGSTDRRRIGLEAVGLTATANMVEVAGPIRAARSLLSSGGIEFVSNEEQLEWSMSVPAAIP